jgi:autoinducer 2-degrading protein
MLIVHVHVHIKPEFEEAFIDATLKNARASVKEAGVARFDVIQQMEDPTRFILLEVYRDDQAPAQHKETEHYATWRDTVTGMMAEPRYGMKYANLFPDETGWG